MANRWDSYSFQRDNCPHGRGQQRGFCKRNKDRDMAKMDDIRKAVKEIIIQENSAVQIEDEDDYHSEFRDIGIDSLDLMMATLKITEIYGVKFSEDVFAELETVQDIVNLIESKS